MWFNFCVRNDIMLLECMEYLNLICDNVSPVGMREERQWNAFNLCNVQRTCTEIEYSFLNSVNIKTKGIARNCYVTAALWSRLDGQWDRWSVWCITALNAALQHCNVQNFVTEKLDWVLKIKTSYTVEQECAHSSKRRGIEIFSLDIFSYQCINDTFSKS